MEELTAAALPSSTTPVDGIRADWTRHDYDVGNADAYSLSYVRKF